MNYSVIIPYRNTYDLLVKCIDSIPDRKDIQIIIVDNSECQLSTDLIPKKQFAKILYLISDSTKGAGHARNVGLKYAEGDYILFADADDYFSNAAFNSFDNFISLHYDIVYFKADSIMLLSGKPSRRHDQINPFVDDYMKNGNEDAVRYKVVVPYCKLFSRQFILNQNIFFDETKVSNDMMFSIKTGHAATSISADSDIVYIITEGEKNSSLTKTKSKENQYIRFQVAVSQYKFMESIGKKNLRFHLLSFVVHSLLDFGFAEFVKYVKYVKENKVNIFLF